MFQMRRYVGENVARQMDGDLVPYGDAILFAEEQTKVALEKAMTKESRDDYWFKRNKKVRERIAALETTKDEVWRKGEERRLELIVLCEKYEAEEIKRLRELLGNIADPMTDVLSYIKRKAQDTLKETDHL